MAQKKKWVAFKSNTTVPADVLGEDRDRKMQVGDPVQLPEPYARHVVQDGFAAFCDAPKKSAAPKKSTDDAKQKLEEARARVDDLNAKMADISEGDDGWSDLADQLDEAVTDLAALEPAA